MPPRVQFLRHLNGERDVTVSRGSFLEFLIGRRNKPMRSLGKPYGVAMMGARLYVTDTMGRQVHVLDLANKSYRAFGLSGEGRLRKPANIRIGPDGNLYVADTERQQVVVFNPDGRYVTEYGDAQTNKPADLVILGDELYALDVGTHSVKVFDLNTHVVKRSFGIRGKKPGEFNYPVAITADADGNLYICDSMNFRVQKLDRDGKALSAFGEAGRNPGTLARPRGLAVARDGLIHVADARLGIVQIFDPQGQALMHYGGTGTGPGELYLPAQVYIDYDNIDVFRKDLAPDFVPEYLIFVVNQLGDNGVSVFAFGHREGSAAGPVTPAP